VHFACHGLVRADQPQLSSLALTPDDHNDGFLTVLEVFRMRIPADLVVLSACETAKGRIYKAEGVIGFTRAFMLAGAPRVIVSLWKVDDEATRALMVKFYELWNPTDGSKGLATATALKKAQEYVASHEKWKHPYHWAAWQLWGLGD
jgi:CHAT domain-containing protein